MTVILDPLDIGTRLVQPALLSAIDRLDPQTRRVCGYHLGFWGLDGEPENAGGKGVRGVLALLSAQAVGAPPEVGVPGAAAVELVHNFSLLHDDVMDGDRYRRHRLSVWAAFGTSAAILAGDALLGLAEEILAEADSANTCWAVRNLSATTRRLIAGQQADLAFEARDDVTLAECRQMASDKTSALLACAASIGVVLADGPVGLAQTLSRFGTHLGAAFQLIDDLLGIWGRPETTGKPVLSDLRSRKKSLPVVAALQSDTAAGRRLAELYLDREPAEEAELELIASLVEEAGGRAWAEATADAELLGALTSLRERPMDPDLRGQFEELAIALGKRES